MSLTFAGSLGDGGGRALAEALRLNTALMSLNLGFNHLFVGAGPALAESVHLNTTLTSLNLHRDCLGDGGGPWQRHCASTPS